MSAIKKVVLLGANGNLGPAILQVLVDRGFQPTVLKRASSKSASDYPKPVKVVSVPDAFEVSDLIPVLTGQDALIATIKGTQTDLQKRLVDAAAKAGVKRFIPADFGSCDSSSRLAQELVPLYKNKTELREYLQQAAGETPSFSWTSIVCGHFLDWDLGFVHLFVKEGKADVLDEGQTKFSLSTLGRVADATVSILERPEQTANRVLFVQSFCVTQWELIRAFERADGREWVVRKLDSEAFQTEEKAKAERGDLEAVEHLVYVLGVRDGNWTTRPEFAMELLGLEDEDLDVVAKRALAKAKSA